MRFWVFSDLHIDVGPYELPEPRPAHDAVLIAGDICAGMVRGVRWIASQGLNQRPVVYIGGNHEFYGTTRDGGLQAAREEAARHRNIHLLQDDEMRLGGLRILGATLWTDYKLNGEAEQPLDMQRAQLLMNDHRAIKLGRAGFRRWLPFDAWEEHKATRRWLDRSLPRRLRAGQVPVVVVTHHAPSPRSIAPQFAGSVLNPAFCSDLEPLLGRANLWVHGHSHAFCDYRVGRARVVNNPRGYVGEKEREETGFDPALVVEVGEGD
jgi:predicted phosphodiesterase